MLVKKDFKLFLALYSWSTLDLWTGALSSWKRYWFSGKCLAITGRMLSSNIVLYFSELIFPVIHVNVPTPYQQIDLPSRPPPPISLLDIFCPVCMESSHVYILHRVYGKYILLLVPITIWLSSENITLFQFPSTAHLLFSIHQGNRFLLFSALTNTFFFKTLFWNPCCLKWLWTIHRNRTFSWWK